MPINNFIEINKLKKGEFLKIKESSKTVFVYDGYNRTTKKYSVYAFDDISRFREFKKGTIVHINFEF
ncbi:MAG: hypothetical protein DI598_17555 [Pseudopedobacter saltans]|uniref:Uncharacterized protein n=1 Tax=Pseudopedobacter saltans TaxID=151895 RepID=A0A2W5ECB7_9SPHI|nr:MAG: hypothetical protein DI598_17555 [Pseudopedobacter saltans]